MTQIIKRNEVPEEKAIRCRLNWVMDESMLLLLLHHIWEDQIEGKSFVVSRKGGLRFSLRKEDPAFRIRLENGNWEFSLNCRIRIFSHLTGSKNSFEGPLLIRGKTGRKLVDNRARFKTELDEIKWQKGTRIKFGPFSFPLSGINNIVFGALKNTLARGLDKFLDKLVLSSNEISADQLKEINKVVNEWIPGPQLFTRSLRIETGSPGMGQLPLCLEASFALQDVGKSEVSVYSAHFPQLGPSVSEIEMEYCHVAGFLPTIEQKFPFLHFSVDCVRVGREGSCLQLGLNLTGNLSGVLVIGIPLNAKSQPLPGKLFFEQIELTSGLRNSLFSFFRRQIRNKMRRDAVRLWQRLNGLLPVNPVWISPPLAGQKIGGYIIGEPEIYAHTDRLSVRFRLSLALGPSDEPLLAEVVESR